MEEIMDQREFLRQMEELVDYGRTKENQLTKSEIADDCSDLALSKEQLELVYAYLREHRIQVEGYRSPSETETADSNETTDKENRKTSGDSKYLRLYRKELRQLQTYDEEAIELLFDRLRRGEQEVVPAVIEAHLNRVVTLAGKYRGRGVPLEDLIQEGNLELTTCVAMLCGNREVLDCKKAIDHAVRSRLIELVDEELSGSDSISMVLARVNLLLEATRTLAEEYGRIATIEELSEFTHMDIEEINMYVDLSRNEIELGKGENRGK